MLKKLILLIIITLSLEAKIPHLTNKDVKTKTEEIFNAHATYKKINPVLAERILKDFVDELDPTKTYFIESDIQKWYYPNEDMINIVIDNFKTSNFNTFFDILNTMIKAIDRRNELEKEVVKNELPKGVNPDEFKDITWVASKKELLDRLLKIKSLQIETSLKYEKESTDDITKRISKKRLLKEGEIASNKDDERKSLVMSYLLKSFCHSLDAHTDYFTPFEANQFMIQVQQKLSGIGAQLKDNLNGFQIVQIIEGSPAKAANLKIGDRIISVNNESVIGMDISDAVEMIRGETGSKVELTIIRKQEENAEPKKFNIVITRGEIVLEDARLEKSYEAFGDGVIVTLKLYSFYQDSKNSSAEDIKNAIEDIKKNHKIKAVLLDLRANTGGLLPQAVDVASLFMSKGIVVSIKDSTSNVQHLRNIDGNPIFDGPLVILVSKTSASASEIVTGTMQDYGRAIIIGDETTFGKGSFQTFTLDASKNAKINPTGEYKVTRGRYYTVSGKSPQLTGVKSDIVIPGVLSELEIGEKFSKYPLETDEIKSNFDDDLSDVPLIHRKRIALLYKHNLQQQTKAFTQYLDILKNNSKTRLENSKMYQSFLKEIKNKNFESKQVEIFGASDLQFIEALNITKDLAYLVELNDKNN